MKSFSQPLFFVFFLYFLGPVQVVGQWTELLTPGGESVQSVIFFGNKYWGINNGQLNESYDGKFWKKNAQQFPSSGTINRLVQDNGRLMIYDNCMGSFFSMSTDSAKTWQTYDWSTQGITNFKQLFVSGNTLLRVSDDNVFRSTDFGLSWQNVLTSSSKLSSKCIETISDGFLLVSSDKVYKSTDNGLTWISSPPLFVYQSTVDPQVTIFNDGEAIFVEYLLGSDTVFRSMDEGQNWELLTGDWNIYSLVSTGGRLFNFLNDLGLVYSLDHGNTWIQPEDSPFFYSDIVKGNKWILVNSENIYSSINLEDWESGSIGLEVVTNSNYTLGLHLASNGDNLLLTTSSSISTTDNEGQSWDFLGINYYTSSEVIYTGDTIFYSKGDYFSRSFDNGKNWELISNPFGYVVKYSTGNFIFATNSIDNNYIYRSNDWGETWEGISFFFANLSTTHKMAYDDTKLLFVNNTGILKSTNFGETFTSYNTGLPTSPNYNGGVWGTGEGSFFTLLDDKLYRLDNNIWIPISGGLNATNGMLKVMPEHFLGSGNSIILIGLNSINNESMLFHSKDGGINWINLSATIPNSEIFHSVSGVIHQNKIFIKGMYGFEKTSIYSLPISEVEFNTYTGSVFNDKNGNGQRESDENGLSNVKLKLLTTQFFCVSDLVGKFNFTTFSNYQDSIIAIPNSPYASITTVPSPILSGNILQGVHYKPNIYDLCIDAALSTPLRPGFNNTLYLTLKNVGTENTDGWVKFMVPSGINIVSTNPAAAMNSGDSICWNFNDLAPFASLVFTISFVVETNVSIGQIINLRAVTGSTHDDANELNNASVLRETVVGSYDPNDKKCVPESITPQIVQDGERLKYTIRFQNTGNYPATFVRIIDTLEANLDLSSVEILSASHAFTWTLRRENVLEFFFDNINLPDSTNDEPNSHGFVQFSIKAKKTLQLGDKVQNRAFIYFDYNAPVETNTVKTNVQTPVWTLSSNKVDFDFELSPNPGHGVLNLTFKNLPQRESSFVSIVDAAGKLIYEKEIFGNEQMVRFNGLAAGSYVVLVKIGGAVVAKKWVSF
jgi:uncharacterized repeat protein (TIGR01451 family)